MYSVRANSSAGVPVTVCVDGSRLTPLGSAGVSVYRSVPLPPLANGNLTGVILSSSVHSWSATIPSKLGVESGSTRMVNVSVALSPSASVAVSVYSLSIAASLGVPHRMPPLPAASMSTFPASPLWRRHTSELPGAM